MKISVMLGDITRLKVDAVVNAANGSLLGGGGVDGAIHRAGGPKILEECRKMGGCPTGGAKATTGGNLPAKYVIHTVGPVYSGLGQDAALLTSAYRRSLMVADGLGAKSVAFPNISTGVYGYPKEEAARVAIAAVKGYAPRSVQEVIFCCFERDNYDIYNKLMAVDYEG